MAEGKGVEPSGRWSPARFSKPLRRRGAAFQWGIAWSRMQDSNPRRLVTKQVLWPVELIRHL
jgi:hypothetical protein